MDVTLLAIAFIVNWLTVVLLIKSVRTARREADRANKNALVNDKNIQTVLETLAVVSKKVGIEVEVRRVDRGLGGMENLVPPIVPEIEEEDHTHTPQPFHVIKGKKEATNNGRDAENNLADDGTSQG